MLQYLFLRNVLGQR